MAGGGTGGAGQIKPQSGFPTWGQGVIPVPGAKKPEITFKYSTGLGNPFGPGFVLPSQAVQGYEWKVNAEQEKAFAIALIGDKTGRYIPSGYSGEGAAGGSPLSRDEAIAKIITDASAKPGGILALKKQLDEKQMYNTPRDGKASITSGDALDGNFYAALATALDAATGFNASLAAQQGNVSNPKIYSFEQFLVEAPKTGVYNSTSFGGGGGGRTTRITHQKFSPEDFDIAIDQLFQQTVGRGATEEELNEFVTKLQAYEKNNPQKIVSTTSGDTTKVVQSGGVSGDIIASKMREEALAAPEAESYNKGTKYLSYFMEALNNPIELG